VLKLVGEGTFSQLIVAEDTFAPSPPSQHHLGNSYGCSTIQDTPHHSADAAAAAAAVASHSPSTPPGVDSVPVIPRYRLVALKVMNSKYAFIGVQELDKLFTLNQRDQHAWCPIVRVQGPGAFYFHTHLVIVLELLGPALLAHMKSQPRGRLPVHQLRKIAMQMVLALGYVSTAGMIHGDIKPENVLLGPGNGNAASPSSVSNSSGGGGNGVNSSGGGRPFGGVSVKLIDFGNAMTLSEAQAYYEDFEVQTLYYRAPEVVCGVKFNQQIDMWSLGQRSLCTVRCTRMLALWRAAIDLIPSSARLCLCCVCRCVCRLSARGARHRSSDVQLSEQHAVVPHDASDSRSLSAATIRTGKVLQEAFHTGTTSSGAGSTQWRRTRVRWRGGCCGCCGRAVDPHHQHRPSAAQQGR